MYFLSTTAGRIGSGRPNAIGFHFPPTFCSSCTYSVTSSAATVQTILPLPTIQFDVPFDSCGFSALGLPVPVPADGVAGAQAVAMAASPTAVAARRRTVVMMPSCIVLATWWITRSMDVGRRWAGVLAGGCRSRLDW